MISLQSNGLSRVLSNTTVQKHQFFGTQLSLQLNSYIRTTWKNHSLTRWTFPFSPNYPPIQAAKHHWAEFSVLYSRSFLVIHLKYNSIYIRSDQLLTHVRLFVTPWIAARQASLSITNSQSSLRLMSIESVMPSSHLILCRPLLLLPPIPPSIRVFSNESTLRMRWPKYWSFSFSIIPSKEIPGLISLQSKGLSRVFSNTTFPIVYFSLLDNICLDKDSSRKQSLEIWCSTYLMLNDPVINTSNWNILVKASSWGQDHDGNIVF